MALSDDIAALPVAPSTGQTGHTTNHGTVHLGLQSHQLAIPGPVASITPSTTSSAPVVSKLNLYDASAGNIIPVLPTASSVKAGTVVGFKKVDASVNAVTPTCSGTDHINSTTGATSGSLLTQNQIVWFSSDGVAVWVLAYGYNSLSSLDTRYSLSANARIALARVPDTLIAGTVTRDANEAATSAPVQWPDGTAGTYTATTVSTAFPGSVDAYHITYGSPTVLKTYTQPAVTRDAAGAITTYPAIVVS